MSKHDTLIETVKAAPPVGVAGLSVAGIPLEAWAVGLTILYTLFLIIDKLPTVIERFRQFGRWLKGRRDRIR